MPIKIPNDLPAFKALEKERIFVIPNDRAEHQDIRALSIAILNLMPDKITTETQLLRLLSNTPLHVDIELIQMNSHVSKNTSQEHMLAFYKTFDEIKDNRYDGLIITGAPIELLDFEQVDYWDELCSVLKWSLTHVYSTIHICWGAQAALYYHYGIPKYPLEDKMFGNFKHHIEHPESLILKGFGEKFEDYDIVYQQNEHIADPAGNVLAENGNTLAVTRSLFDNDAIMIDKPNSKAVTLKSRKSERAVTVKFPQSDCIAVWSPTGDDRASFVCLEPWTSVPVYADDEYPDIEKKPHAVKLEAGKVFSYAYEIEVR